MNRPRRRAEASPADLARRWRATAAEHRVFVVLVAIGAVLRLSVMYAYQPAFQFAQDSFSYLHAADRLHPDVIRPIGYSFFLKILSLGGTFLLVPITQHLLGIASATLIYLLLCHYGVRRGFAAAAASPLLLSGYQLNIEHFVLAETLFQFLVIAGFTTLLMRPHPSPARAALVGGLLGAAALTRTVGLPLIVLALAYLVIRRAGVVPVACTAATAAILVGGYAAWFATVHGRPGLENYSGYFLAGRVSPLADCRNLRLPPIERPLCDRPARPKHKNSDWYIWNPQAPLRRPVGPPGEERSRIARSFALHVIRQQPLDYAASVTVDLAHYFAPGRWGTWRDGDRRAWNFPKPRRLNPWLELYPPSDPYIWNWTWPGNRTARHSVLPARYGFGLERLEPRISAVPAHVLRAYQAVVYVPGPLLAVALFVGARAGLRRGSPAKREVRAAALLLAAAGAVLIVLAAATATFDYRYLLPAEPLFLASGLLGSVAGGPRRKRQGGRWRPDHRAPAEASGAPARATRMTASQSIAATPGLDPVGDRQT